MLRVLISNDDGVYVEGITEPDMVLSGINAGSNMELRTVLIELSLPGVAIFTKFLTFHCKPLNLAWI